MPVSGHDVSVYAKKWKKKKEIMKKTKKQLCGFAVFMVQQSLILA